MQTEELEVSNPRTVRATRVGEYVVSTVSLDIDDPVSSALVGLTGLFGDFATSGFETMIFSNAQWEAADGELIDLYAKKYTGREDAKKGHQTVINGLLLGEIVPDENRSKTYVE